MKSLSSLLAFFLIMAANVAFSQVQLQKRHHLPGYSLDIIKKPTRTKAFVIAAGPRITSKGRVDETGLSENIRIVKKETHSAFYTQASNTEIAETIEKSSKSNLRAYPAKRQKLGSSLRKKLSFIPEGAGLILPIKDFKPRPSAGNQELDDGSVSAVVGFVFTLLAIFLLTLTLITESPGTLALVIGLFFLGILLSVDGRKSEKRGFAMLGIVVSWILLAAGVLVLVLRTLNREHAF